MLNGVSHADTSNRIVLSTVLLLLGRTLRSGKVYSLVELGKASFLKEGSYLKQMTSSSNGRRRGVQPLPHAMRNR